MLKIRVDFNLKKWKLYKEFKNRKWEIIPEMLNAKFGSISLKFRLGCLSSAIQWLQILVIIK